MNLQEMLVFNIEDLESYSSAQAEQLATDVIAALMEGVEGRHQSRLSALLIAAKKHAVGQQPGNSADDVRPDVLQKIKDAEARGDKRTARYLQESMGLRDAAEHGDSGQVLVNAANKFIEDNIAASEAAKKQQQDELIRTRTQDLWHSHGFTITEEQAREMATREVMGQPAYEDDVNEPPPARPDRDAILRDANRSGS